MSWTAKRTRTSSRAACLASLLLLCGCGRLGFDETQTSGQVKLGEPRQVQLDAGDDGVTVIGLDAAPPGPASDAGGDAAPAPGPDASPADAAMPDAAVDAAPPPPPPDPACNAEFPRRLWPSASDVASCMDSFGNVRTTTGPGSADYTVYGGCATWLEFEVTAGSELQLRTFGDGCQCVDCSLWHIHYQLQEDLGAGLTPRLEVSEPDQMACPGGVEVQNFSRYTPLTGRVRLQALSGTTGAGFYFVACGS